MPRGLRLVKPLVWPGETVTVAAAMAPEEDKGDEEVEEEVEKCKDEGAGNDGTNCWEEEGWAGNGASGTMATPRSEPRSSSPPSKDVCNDGGEGGDTGAATTAAAASTALTTLGTSGEIPARRKDSGGALQSGTTGLMGSETLVGNNGNDST